MRIRPLLVAGSLVLGGPAVLLSPAQAAETCRTPLVAAGTASPEVLGVGTTGASRLYLEVRVDDPCQAVESLEATVTFPPGGRQTFGLGFLDRRGDVDVWGSYLEVPPAELENANAGTWRTSLAAALTDGRTLTLPGPSATVVRAARLATNAAPEPVARGRTITVQGDLTRANWDTDRYAGYTRRAVDLQFRTPSGRYATVRTVRTDGSGHLRTTVTADRDGCYRYRFAGSSTTAAVTSGGDCVDVT